MKRPSSLSWQAVAVIVVGIAAAVYLYVAVPASDPMRTSLVTAFNGLIGALTVYLLGRRQDRTESKVDKVIEQQTNGHDTTGR